MPADATERSGLRVRYGVWSRQFDGNHREVVPKKVAADMIPDLPIDFGQHLISTYANSALTTDQCVQPINAKDCAGWRHRFVNPISV